MTQPEEKVGGYHREYGPKVGHIVGAHNAAFVVDSRVSEEFCRSSCGPKKNIYYGRQLMSAQVTAFSLFSSVLLHGYEFKQTRFVNCFLGIVLGLFFAHFTTK